MQSVSKSLKGKKYYKFQVYKRVCLHVSSATSHQQTSHIPYVDEFAETPHQCEQIVITLLSVKL